MTEATVIATVYGNVADRDGHALMGLTVDIFDADTAALVTSTTTRPFDPEDYTALGSNFKIALPASRAYVARVSDPLGRYVTTFSGEHDADATNAYTFTTGEPSPRSLWMRMRQSAATLQGDVRVYALNEPAAGIRVRVVDRGTLLAVAEGTSDDNGRFEIPVPAQRDLLVQFHDPTQRLLPSYASDGYREDATLANALVLHLEHEGYGSASASLRLSTQRFDGIVREPDGTPSNDAECTVRDRATGELIATTTTDASGAYVFELKVPPSGMMRHLDLRCQDRAGYFAPARDDRYLHADGSGETRDVTMREPSVDPASDRATIIGSVSSNGVDVGGISISIIDTHTASVVATATSDERGYYRASVLAPGDYTAQISDPSGRFVDGLASHNYAGFPITAVHVTPGTIGNMQATPLHLPSGAYTRATVNGCVSKDTTPGEWTPVSSREPASGIVVSLIDPRTWRVEAEVTTDAQGCYTAGVAAPSTYLAHFRDPSGVFAAELHEETLVMHGGTATAPLVTYTLLPHVINVGVDGATVNEDLRYTSSSATGTGMLTVDSRLPAIVVDLETLAIVGRTTGGHQSSTLQLPAPRRYIAIGRDAAAGTCFFANRRSPSGACSSPDLAFAPLWLVSSETRELGIYSEPIAAQWLSGTATDRDGQPVSGIDVTAIGVVRGDRHFLGRTATDGTFTAKVPAASYLVVLSDPSQRFATTFYGGTSLDTAVATGTFAQVGSVQLADITAPPTTTTIFGTLTHSTFDGQAGARGAEVTVLSLDGGRIASATADDAGHYSMEVPGGRYVLAVSDPRRNGPWSASIMNPEFLFESGRRYEMSSHLPSSLATLHGSADGETPIAVYDDTTLELVATPELDYRGRFEVNVPAGTYTVRGGNNERSLTQYAALARESETLDVGSFHSYPSTGGLRISVSSQGTGSQIPATIELHDAKTFTLVRRIDITDVDHEAQVSDLAPGTYVAIASSPNYRTAMFSNAWGGYTTLGSMLPIQIQPILVTANSDMPARVSLRPIPRADAGSDQSARDGTTVTLDATNSVDESPWLRFTWTQLAGPRVDLTTRCEARCDDAQMTFVAPTVSNAGAVLTFKVEVDNGYERTTDTVDITVFHINRAPVTAAGADQIVSELSAVQLDASASYDLDDDQLAFEWRQTAGPAVELLDASTATPSFVAPTVGRDPVTLMFEVRALDGTTATTDLVSVRVENINHAPSGDAGADQAIADNVLGRLDASASTDPDGDELEYYWTQLSGPEVELSIATMSAPTFTAPRVPSGSASLVFELAVSDGLASHTDRVTVVVTPSAQPPRCDFATVSSDMLWPPNKKLIPVAIGGVTADGGEAPAITVLDVTQDEKRQHADADVVLVDGTPYLRADRAGSGDGRVYRLRFRADASSGSCTGEVRVCVRRDASSTSCGAGQTWYSSR